MNNQPIGILDSGVGGLTVLKQLKKKLPYENVVYIGDTLRMPYGNKTDEEIIRYADTLIDFLEHKKVKAILLACNSVSTYIDKLTSKTKLISIIEAGAHMATQMCPAQKVGLIATKATVDGNVYTSLLPNFEVVSQASTQLPTIIDKQFYNTKQLYLSIKECIEPLIKKNIHHLILGCSHFPIISKYITELYPQLNLIDPAIMQIDMLRKYLYDNDLLAAKANKTPYLNIYTTDNTYEFASFIKRLNLEIDKLQKVQLEVD